MKTRFERDMGHLLPCQEPGVWSEGQLGREGRGEYYNGTYIAQVVDEHDDQFSDMLQQLTNDGPFHSAAPWDKDKADYYNDFVQYQANEAIALRAQGDEKGCDEILDRIRETDRNLMRYYQFKGFEGMGMDATLHDAKSFDVLQEAGYYTENDQFSESGFGVNVMACKFDYLFPHVTDSTEEQKAWADCTFDRYWESSGYQAESHGDGKDFTGFTRLMAAEAAYLNNDEFTDYVKDRCTNMWHALNMGEMETYDQSGFASEQEKADVNRLFDEMHDAFENGGGVSSALYGATSPQAFVNYAVRNRQPIDDKIRQAVGESIKDAEAEGYSDKLIDDAIAEAERLADSGSVYGKDFVLPAEMERERSGEFGVYADTYGNTYAMPFAEKVLLDAPKSFEHTQFADPEDVVRYNTAPSVWADRKLAEVLGKTDDEQEVVNAYDDIYTALYAADKGDGEVVSKWDGGKAALGAWADKHGVYKDDFMATIDGVPRLAQFEAKGFAATELGSLSDCLKDVPSKDRQAVADEWTRSALDKYASNSMQDSVDYTFREIFKEGYHAQAVLDSDAGSYHDINIDDTFRRVGIAERRRAQKAIYDVDPSTASAYNALKQEARSWAVSQPDVSYPKRSVTNEVESAIRCGRSWSADDQKSVGQYLNRTISHMQEGENDIQNKRQLQGLAAEVSEARAKLLQAQGADLLNKQDSRLVSERFERAGVAFEKTAVQSERSVDTSAIQRDNGVEASKDITD